MIETISRQTVLCRVYLQGEAPRIGAGWRRVRADIGYKYVKLTGSAGRKQTIGRSTWEMLAGHAVPIEGGENADRD